MHTAKPAMNAQIYAEASEWLVDFRLGEAGSDQRRAFYAWLRTSPEHVRAYLELAAIWNDGVGLDPTRKYDDEVLLRDIRSDTNVIAIERDAALVAAPGVRRKHTRRPWLAVAAALVLAIVPIGSWWMAQRDTYRTTIGELRKLRLPDGSSIELNALSRIRVNYQEHERGIELIEGQALFQVAKDAQRPFVVSSGSTRVRAVGTQFDVHRKVSGTTVTVVEGRVEVASFGASSTIEAVPAPLLLAAGEQTTIATQQVAAKVPADAAAVTAWTEGRLVFKAMPLGDVVNEFNRYNAQRLVIRDPQLADLNITGMFASTDPAPFIRFLASRPDLNITEYPDEVVIDRRAVAEKK